MIYEYMRVKNYSIWKKRKKSHLHKIWTQKREKNNNLGITWKNTRINVFINKSERRKEL